jgi:hypothetical protein
LQKIISWRKLFFENFSMSKKNIIFARPAIQGVYFTEHFVKCASAISALSCGLPDTLGKTTSRFF